MFSNMVIAAKAVAPMFILIGIGMLVRRAGIVTQEENRHFNRMVFLVFFSCIMFNNIYNAKLGEVFDGKLLAYGGGSVFLIFLLSILFVTRIEKDPKKTGAMVQAIFRSNYVLMGIPMTGNIFGASGPAIAVATMLAAVIVPMFNTLAVIELEIFRGGRASVKKILGQLVRNPMLMGAAAGLLVNFSGYRLPGMVEDLVSQMAAVGTPLALVILGISFDFSQIRRGGRDLWISVAGRLVVVPAIFLTGAALLGFRGAGFVALIAVFASPCAVSSYVMAENMGSDGQLAASTIIMSSLLSCVTLFIWVFLFKTLGMF